MADESERAIQQTSLADLTWREARDDPWKDGELLEQLYIDQRLSMNQIRKRWDCSATTVGVWLEKHGIRKRTRSEAAQNAHSSPYEISYYTYKRGHEIAKSGDDKIPVHRLQAIAEWGAGAVKGKHVHHINGIPWDNRIGNLELVSNSEHQRKHLKIDGIDRIRVAELYEHGTISSRKLAAMFDVTGGTVLDIHKEFYGGGS